MMRSAAVFGCGPAGLMAAHRLTTLDYDVTIFSIARKSHLNGAQYLHASIPGLPCRIPATRKVGYKLEGTIEDYRDKVYGAGNDTQWSGRVSPDEYGVAGSHYAWDIRSTYDILWDTYGQRVVNTDITPKGVDAILKTGIFDIIVSSVPAPVICHQRDRHMFTSQQIWAIGDAPALGQRCPVRVSPFTVVCNGTRDVGWYRCANVFGYTTAEWPYETKPPIEGIVEVNKPLHTTCDCYPEILRVGRYGKWTKGELSHSAFHALPDQINDLKAEVR